MEHVEAKLAGRAQIGPSRGVPDATRQRCSAGSAAIRNSAGQPTSLSRQLERALAIETLPLKGHSGEAVKG